MNWLQAIVLGLIQGLTEFLPVSSSGHLAIGREILGAEVEGDIMFEVVVHVATVLATIIVFRKQILELLRGLFKFRYNDETDYILKICLSMVPVFIVGVFFKDFDRKAQGGRTAGKRCPQRHLLVAGARDRMRPGAGSGAGPFPLRNHHQHGTPQRCEP